MKSQSAVKKLNESSLILVPCSEREVFNDDQRNKVVMFLHTNGTNRDEIKCLIPSLAHYYDKTGEECFSEVWKASIVWPFKLYRSKQELEIARKREMKELEEEIDPAKRELIQRSIEMKTEDHIFKWRTTRPATGPFEPAKPSKKAQRDSARLAKFMQKELGRTSSELQSSFSKKSSYYLDQEKHPSVKRALIKTMIR